MKIKYVGDHWYDLGRVAETFEEHDTSYVVKVEMDQGGCYFARWPKNDVEVIEE